MIEEFVTFEIAKKLKEKGYPQIEKSNLAMYDVDGEQLCELCSLESFNDTDYACPTISQVLKWLREKKKISIEIGIHSTLKWMCSIYDFSNGIRDITLYDNDGIDDTIYIFYESYELTALAAIEYVLEKII